MNKSVSFILLICCFLSGLSGLVYAENFMDIYLLAAEQDPTLKAAKHELLSKKHRLPQSKAKFLPEITGEALVTNNNSSDPIVGHYVFKSYAVNLNQTLINLTFWNQLKRTQFEIAEAYADYYAAEQDLVLRVAERYFSVLRANDALYYARKHREAVGKIKEQSEAKLKVRLMSIADVETDRAKYDIAVSNEISAENEVIIAKEKLREVIGVEVPPLVGLKENITLTPPSPMNVEEWVCSVQQRNFEIESFFFKTRSAFQDIRIYESAHLPSLKATGKFDRSTGTPPTTNPLLFRSNTSVGFNLSVPIYSGGAMTAKTYEMVELFEKSNQELEAKKREIESNARQAFHGMLTQISQSNATKHTVHSTELAMSSTKTAFDVGMRTAVDVLNAQSDYFKSQQDFGEARYKYILESFRLKKAAGILSCKDVQMINKWLK